MNDYTTEEMFIIETARKFAQKRLALISSLIDEEGQWHADTIREMGEIGLMGTIIPEKYGGCFQSYRAYYGAIKEIASVSGSHALTLLSHSFCAHLITINATEEQKESYLPKMSLGKWLGAVAMTEPNAGSDLSQLKTKAVEQDGIFYLTGRKQFITNGSKAQIVAILAQTSDDKSMFNKSLFLVESSCKGFSAGRSEKKMGFKGSDTSEIILDNILLNKNNLLGKKGQAMLTLMNSLQCSRLAMASLALGIAESAFNEALRYSRERRQFGKRIGEFESIQEYLADSATELECSRLLLEEMARRQDLSNNTLAGSSMAKYYCSEAAVRIVSRALQIFGAYGYICDFTIERLYREARLCTIVEGTSEILRGIIAKNLIPI